MFLKSSLLFAIVLLVSQTGFSQTATLKGVVFDAVSKDGLPAASVTIRNTTFKKVADDKGAFEIGGLPSGEYDVTIESIGYAAVTRHIVVRGKEVQRLFCGTGPERKEPLRGQDSRL